MLDLKFEMYKIVIVDRNLLHSPTSYYQPHLNYIFTLQLLNFHLFNTDKNLASLYR